MTIIYLQNYTMRFQPPFNCELSRMKRLEEGLWCRLYLKEVTGRGPGPRRRGGAMMSSTSHKEGRAAAYR